MTASSPRLLIILLLVSSVFGSDVLSPSPIAVELGCDVYPPELFTLSTFPGVTPVNLTLLSHEPHNYTITYTVSNDTVQATFDIALVDGDWLNTMESVNNIHQTTCNNNTCTYQINNQILVGQLRGTWVIKSVTLIDRAGNTVTVPTDVTLFTIVDSGIFIESSVLSYSTSFSSLDVSQQEDILFTINITTQSQSILTQLYMNYMNEADTPTSQTSLFIDFTPICCLSSISTININDTIMYIANWTTTVRIPARNITHPSKWTYLELTMLEHKIGRFHDYFYTDIVSALHLPASQLEFEFTSSAMYIAHEPSLTSIVFQNNTIFVSAVQDQTTWLDIHFSDNVVFQYMQLTIQHDDNKMSYIRIDGSSYVQLGYYRHPFIVHANTPATKIRVIGITSYLNAGSLTGIKYQLIEDNQPSLDIINSVCPSIHLTCAIIPAPQLLSLTTFPSMIPINLTHSHSNYIITYTVSADVIQATFMVSLKDGDWSNTMEPVIDTPAETCKNVTCTYTVTYQIQVGQMIGTWDIISVTLMDRTGNNITHITNTTLFTIVDSGSYIESSLVEYSASLSHTDVSTMDDILLTINITTLSQSRLTGLILKYQLDDAVKTPTPEILPLLIHFTPTCCLTSSFIYVVNNTFLHISTWSSIVRLPARNITRPGNWSYLELTMEEHEVGRFRTYFYQDIVTALNLTTSQLQFELTSPDDYVPHNPKLVSIAFSNTTVIVSSTRQQIIWLDIHFSNHAVFQHLDLVLQWYAYDEQQRMTNIYIDGISYSELGHYRYAFIIFPNTAATTVRVTQLSSYLNTGPYNGTQLQLAGEAQPTLQIINNACVPSPSSSAFATWLIAVIVGSSVVGVILTLLLIRSCRTRRAREREPLLSKI